MKTIGKLVVIGVGLIGGSAALALRRAGLVGHVTGVGRSRANLDEALRLGILDAATDDYAEALAGADVVLVATPVAQDTAGQFPGKHLPLLCIQTIGCFTGKTQFAFP